MMKKELVLSNINIYKSIADESYQMMVEAIQSATGDPTGKSFKHAMISVVFTGMWLEALLHILIVNRFNADTFFNYDRKNYEKKLILLGCTDPEILKATETFRLSRKSIVHEKAYDWCNDIKLAQEDAENAHQLLVKISEFFAEELA